MSRKDENEAWKGVDRHRRPPKKRNPKTGTWRRKGCAITAIGIGGAFVAGVAQLRGLR